MNPLIMRQGICDPHIHIFEGKAYLYATCDDFLPGTEHFQMTRWKIFSSEDLVHWTEEGEEKPENFYCGAIDQCWAVDAAKRDGKYYWYFSEGDRAVGVGVSDSPSGPFKEALGEPLVGMDTPPVGVKKWDPCVFTDDDGEAYLICGFAFGDDEYLIARLNPDMCSIAEPLRPIEYIGNINGRIRRQFIRKTGCIISPMRHIMQFRIMYTVLIHIWEITVQILTTAASLIIKDRIIRQTAAWTIRADSSAHRF